jgi:hypothetical protein
MARSRSQPAEPARALRIATHYENPARDFRAAVAFVGALDWIKL